MTIRHTAAALVAALTLFSAPLAVRAGLIEPELLTAAQAAPQVDFVLLLTDKADLKAATANARTKREKGAATIAALKAAAARSQGGVLAALQARGLQYQTFWIANAITTRGSLADIEALAKRADVAGLFKSVNRLQRLPDTIARASKNDASDTEAAPRPDYVAKALGDKVEPGIALVRAPAVWNLGFRGQGVVVGDHDIGVQWDHPALKNQYRGWDGTTASHAYNWRNAFPEDNFCPNPEVPCDSNGHGTHTTGTMVGYDGGDNQIGMAPEAEWIACRSLYDPVLGVGTVATYLDCMEWQIAPYPEGEPDAADPEMAPDVVNNSWGCLEACAPPLLKDANDAIYEAGIVQVVSAGNDGDACSTIAFPIAVYESSFTVGASTVADAMADFSSRGPVLSDGSMRLKPNVTAPGVATRSSVPGNAYGNKSGTSMAGPHVAGLVALLMSAEPRLKGRVADVRKLVELTSVQTITTVQTCGGTEVSAIPNNVSGWGRIDALNAITMRPQLAVMVKAQPTASVGMEYKAVISVAQPDTGKIDATTVLVDVSLPASVTLVSATTTPVANTVEGAIRTLRFSYDALAPGATRTDELTLKSGVAGEFILSTAAEADQVSPVAGNSAKTTVGSVAAAPITPPVTTPVAMPPAPLAAASSTTTGRFGGGALGGLLLALLGLGVVLRRRPL